jgi:hypothetical protein
MNKIILILTLFSSSLISSFGQSKIVTDDNLKNQIIELEKAAWKAWQDKNPTWFQNNATHECLWVTQGGVSNKAEWVKTGASACDVKSYSFDNFQLVTLNKNAVVITYTAIVDATCGNFKLPNKMRTSVNYVKRNRKWLEAFYMEMPITD